MISQLEDSTQLQQNKSSDTAAGVLAVEDKDLLKELSLMEARAVVVWLSSFIKRTLIDYGLDQNNREVKNPAALDTTAVISRLGRIAQVILTIQPFFNEQTSLDSTTNKISSGSIQRAMIELGQLQSFTAVKEAVNSSGLLDQNFDNQAKEFLSELATNGSLIDLIRVQLKNSSIDKLSEKIASSTRKVPEHLAIIIGNSLEGNEPNQFEKNLSDPTKSQEGINPDMVASLLELMADIVFKYNLDEANLGS